MWKAHEIRLYPTKKQEVFFKKSCEEAKGSALAIMCRASLKQEVVSFNIGEL